MTAPPMVEKSVWTLLPVGTSIAIVAEVDTVPARSVHPQADTSRDSTDTSSERHAKGVTESEIAHSRQENS